MKKVSIIVPFYNVEEYIERSIKSLIEQSLEAVSYTHLTLPTIA